MAKPFRPKRGTTAENNAFIGLPYEVTLDTERHSLRVHDGVTAGGREILPSELTDARYIRTVNGQTPDVNGKSGRISWNFEKFVVTPDGTVHRFSPRTEPDDPAILKVIEASLPAPTQ
jgi:glutathione peroxidase-family protein